MILAAEYIPSPLQLMLTQKSDSLDSPVFPFFPGNGDVPIPDSRLAGNRDRDIPVSRFGRERESGPPGAAGRGFPHAKALSLLDTPINHLVDTSFSKLATPQFDGERREEPAS
jgi:hypothetical protein